MNRWAVLEVRTGRVRSRHKTEMGAQRALDQDERHQARRLNRPGMVGGGYGFVELAAIDESQKAVA